MPNNIFHPITSILNNLVDILTQGSFQRIKIVNSLNFAFKEAYLEGVFDRFCVVSIGMGDSRFKHSMSTFSLRSGFKITIQNDVKISEYDINEISTYVLASRSFVRQLLALGFDTLLINGKNTGISVKMPLENFGNLNEYFLGQ
jgi:hypothetical protein